MNKLFVSYQFGFTDSGISCRMPGTIPGETHYSWFTLYYINITEMHSTYDNSYSNLWVVNALMIFSSVLYFARIDHFTLYQAWITRGLIKPRSTRNMPILSQWLYWPLFGLIDSESLWIHAMHYGHESVWGPYSNSVPAINTLNKMADIVQTSFLKLIYAYDNCCTFIAISSKFFEISSLRCNKQSSFHDDVINWKNNSALLAFCAGNSPVPGEFPAQRPVTRSFDVFVDLQLNKQLSKQRWRCWFEMSSHSLRRHCNVFDMMNWSRVSIMELADP